MAAEGLAVIIPASPARRASPWAPAQANVCPFIRPQDAALAGASERLDGRRWSWGARPAAGGTGLVAQRAKDAQEGERVAEQHRVDDQRVRRLVAEVQAPQAPLQPADVDPVHLREEVMGEVGGGRR